MDKNRIRKNIKGNAKLMLRGRMGTAVLAFLIVGLVMLGLSFVCNAVMRSLGFDTYAGLTEAEAQYYGGYALYAFDGHFNWLEYALSLAVNFLMLFITIPLTFGLCEWFIRLSEGARRPLASVFDWFSTGRQYWKSIGITVNVGIRTFLYYILPIGLIGTGLFTLWAFAGQERNSTKLAAYLLFLFAGLIVLAAAAILLTIWIQRYSLTAYLCIRFPEEKGNKLIRESVLLMKGHRGELAVFGLSFLPWVLLIPLTLGAILFWLLPYATAASVIFFNYVYDVGKAAGIGNMEAFPPYRKDSPTPPAEPGFGELFTRKPELPQPEQGTRYASPEYDNAPTKNEENTNSEEL